MLLVRLFAAVWPPSFLADRLRELPRPSLAGLRWTTPEQWHVTLRFYGDVADDDVPNLIDALSGVALARAPVFVAGPTTAAIGRRVLHVPIAGAEGLAEAVQARSGGFGVPDDRPFRGHLTLARNKGRAALTPLCGIAIGAEWQVTRFALVSSRTEQRGAVYENVAEFPLVSERA